MSKWKEIELPQAVALTLSGVKVYMVAEVRSDMTIRELDGVAGFLTREETEPEAQPFPEDTDEGTDQEDAIEQKPKKKVARPDYIKVMELYADGASVKEIAQELNCTGQTVRTYLKNAGVYRGGRKK